MTQQVAKRLELIKNFITLEEFEAVEMQIQKLREMGEDPQLEKIFHEIDIHAYGNAIHLIEKYIKAKSAAHIEDDPERTALQIEYRTLEKQLVEAYLQRLKKERQLFQLIVKINDAMGQHVVDYQTARLNVGYQDFLAKKADKDEIFSVFSTLQLGQKLVTDVSLMNPEPISDKDLEKMETGIAETLPRCLPELAAEEMRKQAMIILKQLKTNFFLNHVDKVSEICMAVKNVDTFEQNINQIDNKIKLRVGITRLRLSLKNNLETLKNLENHKLLQIGESESNLNGFIQTTLEQIQNQIEQLNMVYSENYVPEDLIKLETLEKYLNFIHLEPNAEKSPDRGTNPHEIAQFKYAAAHSALTDEQIEKLGERGMWDTLSANSSIDWTIERLNKFKDKLNWVELSANPGLKWTVKLIRDFEDRWDWNVLCANPSIPWKKTLIEKFEDKIDWESLSSNPQIPSGKVFLERYEDKWDWAELSGNEGIKWSKELTTHFSTRLNWEILSANSSFEFDESLINEHSDSINWDNLSSNSALKVTCELLEKYEDVINWQFLSSNQALQADKEILSKFESKWNWDALSMNPALKWSAQLIEEFHTKWSWTKLSSNPGIEWDEDIIASFVDILDFGATGLSRNPSVKWSEKLLEKYEDKWDWDALCRNEGLPWSEEFISKFMDHFNSESLMQNQVVWDKVYSKNLDNLNWDNV